jgi:hypothetical protein
VTDEEEDDEDDDDEPRYEWVSNGGCERCDAMDGHLCEEPPPRPHARCNCTIIHRSRPSLSCDETDVRYEISHAANIHHSGTPDPDDEFDIIFDYKIHCWGNTQQISGEVIVSRTYSELRGNDTDDFVEEAMADALELVEEIAADECPSCPAPPRVS